MIAHVHVGPLDGDFSTLDGGMLRETLIRLEDIPEAIEVGAHLPAHEYIVRCHNECNPADMLDIAGSNDALYHRSRGREGECNC